MKQSRYDVKMPYQETYYVKYTRPEILSFSCPGFIYGSVLVNAGMSGLKEAMGEIASGIKVKVKMACASTGFHILLLKSSNVIVVFCTFFSSDHPKPFVGCDAAHPPPCCRMQHKGTQERLEDAKASCSRSRGLLRMERARPGAFSPTLPGGWPSPIPGGCRDHGLTTHGCRTGSVPSHAELALSPWSRFGQQHGHALRLCLLEINFYKVSFSFTHARVTICASVLK